MKKGDRIKIIYVDDNHGQDWQASKMTGAEGVVDYVDSAGQIHLVGFGLALIPSLDIYVVIEQ